MAFTFTVGKKYSSKDELKRDIKRFNEANYVKLIVDDSQTKKAAAKKGIAHIILYCYLDQYVTGW